MLAKGDIEELEHRLTIAKTDLADAMKIAVAPEVIEFGQSRVSSLEEELHKKNLALTVYQDRLRKINGEIAG